MNNKRSTLLLFVPAVVLGLGAAFLVQHWAEQRIVEARKQAAALNSTVVVAASEVEFGKVIDADHVKTIDWPTNALPEGAFTNVADVVGKVSKYDIFTGEPILAERVADPRNGPLLAGLISPNMRAVTVRVDDVVGVAGFLLPGCRVDVVASKRLEQERYETRTVLHDLRVLAVDQTASSSGGEKPVVVRAVTLETWPKDAEVLVQATREGSVQLALRNPGDHTAPDVVSSAAPVETLPAAARHPRFAANASEAVLEIRGTETGARTSVH